MSPPMPHMLYATRTLHTDNLFLSLRKLAAVAEILVKVFLGNVKQEWGIISSFPLLSDVVRNLPFCFLVCDRKSVPLISLSTFYGKRRVPELRF